MEEQEILLAVKEKIYEKPEFIKDIIDALIFGTREKIRDLSEDIIQKDKAMLVLFSKHNLGSDQNLVETATQLTKSFFNGIGKIYNIDDVKKAIKK